VTTIKGTICKGFGRASTAIPLQVKFFVSGVPEIASMKHATINVELENPIHFLKYDFVTRCEWRPQFEETFSFIRAAFWPHAERFFSPSPCLLIFPETSPHRLNPFMVEVITQEMNLSGVENCSIHFRQTTRCADWLVFDD
jgi:hypothetical protein